MISHKIFKKIKKDHKNYASWAIWAKERKEGKPTDNMGDLSIFDDKNITKHLKQLNPNIILVGLNISKEIREPLSNFHGSNGGAYKIRYAFRDSPYWGAYMTDILKGYVQPKAMKMMKHLKTEEGKILEKDNVEKFIVEIKDLGVKNPTIIAFGNDAHTILNRNIALKYKTIRLPHYSSRTNKEEYRSQVRSVLGF
ncbi:MAG: hypothetical protein HOJ13_02205 [Nitrospina sp.]|nr:hypothetical protein [Nitrospina sp.]